MMTNELLKAWLECLKRDLRCECCINDECEHCDLLKKQGTLKERIDALDKVIKALEVVKIIEDAYMSELLKTPMERNVPISDPCDGCQYELNSTNGNPCYSCGKYKLTEQQPCEDCVNRSELQKTMDSLPLFRFVNNDHEEADDYYNCESVDMVIRNLPSVTPRRDLAGLHKQTGCN